MKRLIFSLTLTLLGSMAAVAQNIGPAVFTNSISLTWDNAQSNTLRVLRLEELNNARLAWTVATNADPSYATSNSYPVLASVPAFVVAHMNGNGATSDHPELTWAAQLALLDARRVYRLTAATNALNAAMQPLFVYFTSLTAGQQAAQSNLLWAAKVAAEGQ